MGNKITQFLKIIFPLMIGFVFIYLSVKDTTLEDRATIYEAIKSADYRFVLFSLALGLIKPLVKSLSLEFYVKFHGI